MSLADLIASARAQGASDLHLEPGLPATLRVRGALVMQGEALAAADLLTMARSLIGDDYWPLFQSQLSFDLSTSVRGVRCRCNILKTARGVGFAIRLLSAFRATVDSLNLHPDLKEIANLTHGLVLVSGPTGCGKSSTVAALVQEINATKARHIITIESPIEHHLRPQLSLIRQREVGRDTPSFEQALIDCLREDPDVIVVGEMRDPETMRLTLSAAETGHLVFATVHSASVIEALQRLINAFPVEAQASISAQLADSLAAVVNQRLIYRPDLKIRVPECEILFTNGPVKAVLQQGKLMKLADIMMTSSGERMWNLARYRSWMGSRRDWYLPEAHAAESAGDADSEPFAAQSTASLPRPERRAPGAPARAARRDYGRMPPPQQQPERTQRSEAPATPAATDTDADEPTVIEIGGDDDLESLVKELDRPSRS